VEPSSHTLFDVSDVTHLESSNSSVRQDCLSQLCQQVSHGLDSMSSAVPELPVQRDLIVDKQPVVSFGVTLRQDILPAQPSTG
jgi:hypothetical protein